MILGIPSTHTVPLLTVPSTLTVPVKFITKRIEANRRQIKMYSDQIDKRLQTPKTNAPNKA